MLNLVTALYDILIKLAEAFDRRKETVIVGGQSSSSNRRLLVYWSWLGQLGSRAALRTARPTMLCHLHSDLRSALSALVSLLSTFIALRHSRVLSTVNPLATSHSPLLYTPPTVIRNHG